MTRGLTFHVPFAKSASVGFAICIAAECFGRYYWAHPEVKPTSRIECERESEGWFCWQTTAGTEDVRA